MTKSKIERFERYMNDKDSSYEYKILLHENIGHFQVVVINKITNSFECTMSFTYEWDEKWDIFSLSSSYSVTGFRLQSLNFIEMMIRRYWDNYFVKPNIEMWEQLNEN